MTGLARLIQARARIRFYAPSIAWVVLLLLASLTKDVVLSGSLPNGLNVGAHVMFIVTSLIAVFVIREWFHRVLAPLNIALMLAYIAVLFARLR